MKIAYTVLMPDTKSAIFAWKGDLKEIMENLKAIGYHGIEAFVRDAKNLDVSYFVKLVEKTGLEVAGIGTAPIGADDKLTLTDNSPEVRAEAISRAKGLVDLAAIFNTQVGIGKFRGAFPADKKEEGWKWLNQGIEEICGYAASKGVTVALEPQNKTNLNNLNNTRETLDWIKSTGISNLKILLDTYHMYVEDPSIAAGLVEAKDYLSHVHISDSNRCYPGSSSINFQEVLRVLKALDYQGFLSLEITQKPDSLTAARKSFEYLNFILGELN